MDIPDKIVPRADCSVTLGGLVAYPSDRARVQIYRESTRGLFVQTATADSVFELSRHC
jgi:hypothetical protein